MKVTLAYVSSLNGKITSGDNPDVSSWSSSEDSEHFEKLRAEHDVIILSRTIYDAAHPTPQPGKLRVVYTSTPERYTDESIPGQLEFVDTPPADLIGRLALDGHKKVLLATGATVTSKFLQANVVDDIYLTYEPLLFGTGKPMLSDEPLDVQLQLESISQLNDKGTLLAHYTIIKADL